MRASLGAAHLGQPEDLSALQKSPLGVTTHIRAGITTDDDDTGRRKAGSDDCSYLRSEVDRTERRRRRAEISRAPSGTREYTVKGWTVDDAHVYVDDGITGAEFANRPGFLRLMNALKPRPAFQVLVMSEESRLGREAIEVSYALKQIVSAGVRVFFYLENRERTLDSPTDKIMLSLTTFADELEREKARQRTYDAMLRKAEAGHVTGGNCFGYRNVEIRVRMAVGHTWSARSTSRSGGDSADFRAVSGLRHESDHEAVECGGRGVPTGATRPVAVVGAELGPGRAVQGCLSRARLGPHAETQPVGSEASR